jgi:hypothetical protein
MSACFNLHRSKPAVVALSDFLLRALLATAFIVAIEYNKANADQQVEASPSAPNAAQAVPLPAPVPMLAPISPPTLFPQACSSQTLIGLDPYHDIAYVPIYTLDHQGNAQVAVVDLARMTAVPVRKIISLPGSVQCLGIAYNPANRRMLADGRSADHHVFIYEIDTETASILNVVKATGLLQGVEVGSKSIWGPVRIQPTAGGIVENLNTNHAIVAGTSTVGTLDTSKSPPVWDPHSVISLDLNAESFSLNSNTGLLFMSNLGSDALIDTGKSPLREIPFARVPDKGVTDGVAFDISTNIVIHSEFDGSDQSYAFNFATLDTTQRPATADAVVVPGLGFLPTIGPVPGGQTVINCATHQAIIADWFGPGFRLVQLPVGPVKGPLNNKGQPGSGTVPDDASAHTIAASAIPPGGFGSPHAMPGIVGNPSSLTVDPLHNIAYMLADDGIFYHRWIPGSRRPLFLVRVDLANPILGAGPHGGVDGKTYWKPAIEMTRMP